MRNILTTTLLSFFLTITNIAVFAVQDNPVQVHYAESPPVFDGAGDDACWQNSNWQTIDQVWINYGETIPASDYSGRYKALWNASENMLYFLVEVYDDVFVDGYRRNGSDDIYQHDVIEIFIDEDQSRGQHIFDTATTNAENAFSYHIYADFPAEDEIQTEFTVGDIAGTGWDNRINPEYAPHFPHFALKRLGNTAIWELALKVYDDTYVENNPEASRVGLFAGKNINLSMAYCDNDDPNEFPKLRDNFYGSVWVPAQAYNDHWMDAEYFGTITLLAPSQSSVKIKHQVSDVAMQLYPNPSVGEIRIEINNTYSGPVNIDIYNLLGQEVASQRLSKNTGQWHQQISLNQLPRGLYFVKAQMGTQTCHQKLMIH